MKERAGVFVIDALFSRKSYEKSYETSAIRKRKKDKSYRDGSLHGLFLKPILREG